MSTINLNPNPTPTVYDYNSTSPLPSEALNNRTVEESPLLNPTAIENTMNMITNLTKAELNLTKTETKSKINNLTKE